MASKNYRKQETRYFIGRINNEGLRETLRLEKYNALPTVIRDEFEAGKGFEKSSTANQGVNFFNSVEEEKGDNRQYWYFLVALTNTEVVAINDNTDEVVKEYFKRLEESNTEQPEEPTEENTEE